MQDGEVIPLNPQERSRAAALPRCRSHRHHARRTQPVHDAAAARPRQADARRESDLDRELASCRAAGRARRRHARGLPRRAQATRAAAQQSRADRRACRPTCASACRASSFAEAYGARQPNTFMYLFTYESPAMRGALRACHALEIPFAPTAPAPTMTMSFGRVVDLEDVVAGDDPPAVRGRVPAATSHASPWPG